MINTERIRRRRRALDQLATLNERPDGVLVIHYSCESFYDRPEGTSPRITSLAVRNWGTGQTVSFSIHQVAERHGKTIAELEDDYDDLEKEMLQDFYRFAEKRDSFFWVHWNMRDINYGFPAIEHRARVLGTEPFLIPDHLRVDLARVLVGLFDRAYIGHPRLEQLVKKNKVTDRDFLTGQEEADAFDAREYVRLHLSTLRKVDVMANILERTMDGTLKTNATWKEIHGSWAAWFYVFVKDHWIVSLLGFLSALAGLIQVIWDIL